MHLNLYLHAIAKDSLIIVYSCCYPLRLQINSHNNNNNCKKFSISLLNTLWISTLY